MKTWQVRAQRKYAQGAHIPVSDPSTPAKKRVVHPGIQNTPEVIYYNNDAKSLLDTASFSNIPRQAQPIVLVKRLEDTLRAINKNPTQNQLIESSNKIVKTPSPQPKKKVKKTQFSNEVRASDRLKGKPRSILKKTISSKNNTKPKKTVKFAEALEAVCPSAATTKDDTGTEEPSTSTFLTEVKNENETVAELYPPLVVTVVESTISSDQDETSAVVAGTEEPSTCTNIKNTFLKAVKNENKTVVKLESPINSDQVETSFVDADSISAGPYYGIDGIERWMSESITDVTTSTVSEIPELPQTRATTRKRKIVKRLTKKRNVPKKCSANNGLPELPQTRATTRKRKMVKRLTKKRNVPKKCSANNGLPTKSAPPEKAASPPMITSSTSPANNTVPQNDTCPSIKFTYLKDVMSASQEDIDKNCNSCPRCQVIKKTVTLSKLIRDRRSTSLSNMTVSGYTDMPVPRARSNGIPTDIPGTSKDGERHAFYMDLLPESKNIVEVLWCEIPGRKESRLSARLVLKTNLPDFDDLTLTNNETLFDKLLELYTEKTHGEEEISEQTNVTKNTADEVPVETQQTSGDNDSTPNASKQTSTPKKRLNANDYNMTTDARKRTDFVFPKSLDSAKLVDAPVFHLELYTEKTHGEEEISEQTNVTKNTADEVPVETQQTSGDNDSTPNASKQTNTPKKRLNANDYNMTTDARKRTDFVFPKSLDSAKLVDAPVFYPTEAEFADPISYFEKIMPQASQFGICKVVPPRDFNPACTLSETTRFAVTNQYIPRLYTRWGPAFREMCAIRSYLASQKVYFTRAPLLEELEVNLTKMYHTVRRLGGLENVVTENRWNRVAEEMHFYQLTDLSKLEHLYVKYLLPYASLNNRQRQKKISEVERKWMQKYQKILARAINPLHRQKVLLGDSDSDDVYSDEEEAKVNTDDSLDEAEECIVPGRIMNLNDFEKVAHNAQKMYIPPNEEGSMRTIENLYWKLVLFGADHVCVNSASIDTGDDGYGFTKNKNSPYGKHPWNLKMISQNNGNILRPLGEVQGLTVPTLHLGMIFSTSCWHRDRHDLPWIEYMHKGPEKIWYGIPDSQSEKFRKAVKVLCPMVSQNKGIWLSSDMTMVPPAMLLEHGVSVAKITQKPREFVIVFPKAYSSSICTGYTISESVYFATHSWLSTVGNVFQELRESCVPTTFGLEQLLIAIAKDPRSSLAVLQSARATLEAIITEELAARAALARNGLQVTINTGARGNRGLVADQDECEICRTTLYLSKVKGVFSELSMLCVQHALRVLVENKADTGAKKIKKDMKLEIFFTRYDLEEIEQILQSRLLSIGGADNQ